MTIHPLTHATTEGPLGFPVTERQAFALDAILKALPKDELFHYRKAQLAQGASEVLPGERSDVSWISTEDPDRTREVVVARGMNDSQFKQNPIVTLQHAYWLPPVGKSLWRKVVRLGSDTLNRVTHGVKAKTQYPVRPADWTGGAWPADVALSLVQADLLRGKSIGFLPTRVHQPKTKEMDEHGWQNVDLVIDEWVMLEYACTFLPTQQNAVVEAVSKSQIELPQEFIQAMGLEAGIFSRDQKSEVGDQRSEVREETSAVTISRFTPLDEIEKALCRRIHDLDLLPLADRATRNAIDRLRGRI
ncbi:MAG TPA: hypothetical protein VG099_08375 [Gemmataceae bacterium]|nr:hypothetical protein [Gemmataceae bacterium]